MNFLKNIINKRLAISFCSRTSNFKLPEIFGKFFEEDKKYIKNMKIGTVNSSKKNTKNMNMQDKSSKIIKDMDLIYRRYNQKIWRKFKNTWIRAKFTTFTSKYQKAHRTKAKEYDKNPGKNTTVEMQKINATKEYLDANLEYYLI